MNRNVVGLAIAKHVFHCFVTHAGKVVNKKLKRSELLTYMAQLPTSVFAMKAVTRLTIGPERFRFLATTCCR